MNAYERWLIRQRHFCDIGSCTRLGERVIKIGSKDKVVCDAHFRVYAPIEAGFESREYFRESAELLKAATEYLQKYEIK